MNINSIETLTIRMTKVWEEVLIRPEVKEVMGKLASGNKKLYGMWLSQVAHLTQHTSAHQSLVATRINEVSIPYMRFCYEHALEEVGHEFMAINDLRAIGVNVNKVKDLPSPLGTTERITAYLYYAATKAHPTTRLGYSFWAESCYEFLSGMANNTQGSLGLKDEEMSFFKSHAAIDEKHAIDVRQIIQIVCEEDPHSWKEIESGMMQTLEMSIDMFIEMYEVVKFNGQGFGYEDFLKGL